MGGTLRKFTSNKIDLKASSLVWLDSSVNTLQESIDAQQRLKLLIKNLKTFESVNLCEQHIKSLHEDDRIALIVSGTLGQKIASCIHDCPQVVAIYVYCGDKQKNEIWAQKFAKIRGLAVQLDELINQIRVDQAKQQDNQINESLTYTTFNANVPTGQLTNGLNGQFLHSQLFIDCLLRIKSTSTDMNELISICEEEYQNDKNQLALVREFKDNYLKDRAAVLWYTRNSFIYRMLNSALRTQNIHRIYLYRFLIRDLEKQLNDNKCSSRLTVYRGQLMCSKEFETLKHSRGELISINSFLSTSINRQQAYSFLRESNGPERILFEIDADPKVPGVKPFANIASLSYYPKEEEVLFMLGSIFRITDINRDRNGVWTIKLTSCSNRDRDLETIFNHMKSQYNQGVLDLVILGDVLRQMGKYDDAERYYRRCLDQLPSDDFSNISICYYALGCISDCQGKPELGLKQLYKSLEIDMKILKPYDSNIAHTYNSIGNIYQTKGDYKQALESYNKALPIFCKALGENHLHVAMCLNNIGAVCQKEKKYSEALNHYQKALIIRQKQLPANHSDLGSSYNNIGVLYRYLDDFDQALEQYELALKIYNVSLPSQHPDIAMTLGNMGIVYEQKSNWEKALSYYEKANAIYRHTLSPTHPDVVQTEQSIRRVSSKLK